MNEDAFNLSIRKFLKKVGITSQREIEKAVREALASGKISANASVPVSITLNIGSLQQDLQISGEIDLQ